MSGIELAFLASIALAVFAATLYAVHLQAFKRGRAEGYWAGYQEGLELGDREGYAEGFCTVLRSRIGEILERGGTVRTKWGSH